MIELKHGGAYLVDGKIVENYPEAPETARKKTMAYSILSSHDISKTAGKMQIKFDALASHDITYVGIIQTARASGLEKFPIPYAMTNCHNSLCAVGGTINEDDHVFGLSAAKKYGGIYVPANLAVIHQYVRENMCGVGKMLLGSDSHTRYGALGTMGVGEGGPELVKQLLNNTYDIDAPGVVMVYLKGKPKRNVGPHDVAIALVKAVFENGFVKNKVLEFVGEGVEALSVEYRMGIDVMTTETTCLSSIWTTDDKVKEYYAIHKHPEDYKKLAPQNGAYYDGVIIIDLDKVEPMIALPFHPSNAYTIKEVCENPYDIFKTVEENAKKQIGEKVDFSLCNKIVGNKIYMDQGVIAGCAGGMFENICIAADILKNAAVGNGAFGLNIYPASQPMTLALTQNGAFATLIKAGAIIKPAFCGPCFGAGDVPSNNGFSARHTTRNFPNREGSKPNLGQISSVALMDARSIAATAKNGGVLTAASEEDISENIDLTYNFDSEIYAKRIYNGFGKPDASAQLKFGPNITDWPKMYALSDNLLLKFCAVIHDAVTTTDELIPSGETSSYRSNPLKLSEFALSRRVPSYVGDAKKIQAEEVNRRNGKTSDEILAVLKKVSASCENTAIGSVIFANKPGDGSAREQAASCQKVLGTFANITYEYATKRYRSNCINWGIIPFTLDKDTPSDFNVGDYIYIPDINTAVEKHIEKIPAKVISGDKIYDITLNLTNLTDEEREIISCGCLMNFYAKNLKK